jgi:hypothetical protein
MIKAEFRGRPNHPLVPTILSQRRQAATLFLNSTLSPLLNEVRLSYQRFTTQPAALNLPLKDTFD